MREFQKVTAEAEVLSYLKQFSDVFPHLEEKIDSLEAYAVKLYQHAEIYVGAENGQTFGLIVFYANDMQTKMAYITLIGIKSGEQGKGLGYWLLTKCQEVCRFRGMIRLSLEVDCDNQNAISFYKRNGFVAGSVTQRNSIYMNKCLE